MPGERLVPRPFSAPDTGADGGFLPEPNEGFPQQPKGSERIPSSELIKSNPFQYLWNVGDALGNFTAGNRKFEFFRTIGPDNKPYELKLHVDDVDDADHNKPLVWFHISSDKGLVAVHELDPYVDLSEFGISPTFPANVNSQEISGINMSDTVLLAKNVQQRLSQMNWWEKWTSEELMHEEKFHSFVQALDPAAQRQFLDEWAKSEELRVFEQETMTQYLRDQGRSEVFIEEILSMDADELLRRVETGEDLGDLLTPKKLPNEKEKQDIRHLLGWLSDDLNLGNTE